MGKSSLRKSRKKSGKKVVLVVGRRHDLSSVFEIRHVVTSAAGKSKVPIGSR